MKANTDTSTAEHAFESTGAAGFQEPSSSENDVLQIALRYKWLLALGLVCGLGLGFLAYQKLGPSYAATSQILVSKKAAVPIKEGAAETYGERGEHIALIMSPMIVGKAVEAHELNRLSSLAGSKEPVEDILDSLRVKRSAGQDRSFLNVLDISYQNSNKKDAGAVVAAVVDAYKAYLAETQQENTSEVVRLISEANSNLMKELREKKRQYLKFRDSAPLHWKNPLGRETAPGDVTNVHQERMDFFEKERSSNLIKVTEIKSTMKALQDAVDSGQSRESLEALVRLFLRSTGKPDSSPLSLAPQTSTMDAQLLPLLMQEQQLLRDYGSDHPDVKLVRQKIDTIGSFYRQRGVAMPGLPGSASGKSAAAGIDLIAVYMQSLEQQLMQVELRNASLEEIYEHESKLAKQFAHYQEQDQTYNDEIAQLKSLWDVVVKRLNELKLVKDNRGYTLKQIAPVRAELVIKRPIKFLGAGGVFGLAVVFGIVFLRVWRDTTLKSLDDIRNSLKLPILGSVPQFVPASVDQLNQDDQTALEPALCYYHRPGSPEAESYRSVRTTLFVCSDDQQNVVQVTSPEPGDGKTTFISNLAIAMAQSGKRVLLIDSDLRRPTVHKLFGVDQEVGMSDVLAGQIEFLNAVKQTVVPSLSLLTAGISPANPAELLSSPRFERLLTDAKREFDFVLVDTPPLLVVSDPCVVASHTDALLLVVRYAKNKRIAAQRAAELLETHGVNVIGVVANGVQRSATDGYGYDRQYTDYLQTDERPVLTPNAAGGSVERDPAEALEPAAH